MVALAPDAASAAAGQSLASAKKWSGVGASPRAVWGLCQGSGKDPYQTRVHLAEPAFKCSCPSRKFPCKHALGLLLLYARDQAPFKAAAEPGWVSEWLDARTQKAEKAAAKSPEPAADGADKPVDEAARAKRAAKRDERVRDGVAECRAWLDDLVRRGLAAVRADAPAFERTAARMVDAQAPGLAGTIRRIAEAMASGDGWEVRTIDLVGRLHLLLKAAARLDDLPPDLATDVRVALGQPQAKEDVLAGPGVKGRWAVVGQQFEEEDRLTVRRTWLVARPSGRPALVLDFVAGLAGGGGAARLDPSLVPGFEIDAELAYYPSRAPLRALVKDRAESHAIATDLVAGPAAGAIEPNLRAFAQALAANPWLLRWPFILGPVRLAREGPRWLLIDRSGDTLPLHPLFATAAGGARLWRLLSLTSGGDCALMAEWDGHAALPLAVLGADGVPPCTPLAPRWGTAR